MRARGVLFTEYVGKHLQRCRVLEGPPFAVDIQVKLGSIPPTFFKGEADPPGCLLLAWMTLIFYSTQEQS